MYDNISNLKFKIYHYWSLMIMKFEKVRFQKVWRHIIETKPFVRFDSLTIIFITVYVESSNASNVTFYHTHSSIFPNKVYLSIKKRWSRIMEQIIFISKVTIKWFQDLMSNLSRIYNLSEVIITKRMILSLTIHS